MKIKINKFFLDVKQIFIAFTLIIFSNSFYSQTTYTFNYTGAIQVFTLQPGTYSIECWGAKGESAVNQPTGGIGGYSTGTYSVTSATTIYIAVGGKGSLGPSSSAFANGGFNGGGQGYGSTVVGAGGGGASHIATVTGVLPALSSNTAAIMIVAGGGGGSGFAGVGGNGGGTVGGNGNSGLGGNTGSTFGQGANGTTAGTCGGGGGGWFGGNLGSPGNTGGAGGGSGYIGGLNSGITVQPGQTGFVANPESSGNGRVHIIELCNISLYAAGNTNSLNPMLCAGQSATLMTNAISNYSWSNGSTASSLVVAPTTNTVYSLTATSPSNCTSSKSISITVSSGLPVLSIANPSNNICLGRTVSLTASGAVSYTWANPGVVNGQTFTPTSTAAYTVTGQNGCGTTVSTTTITVSPLAVSVSASPTLVCQGYPSTLTAVAAVTGFSWQPNNSTGSTAIVAPQVNTIYTVTASDGTCAGTATLAVATKQTPTITASSSSTIICEGDVVSITANGAGTGGSYNWSPTGGAASTFTDMPTTSTAYNVSGTNSLNCTASGQAVVVVKPAPPVTVSANQTLTCIGSSLVLSAGGAGTYSWSNGPQAVTYTVFPTGPTVYTVTGIGANGCGKTRTISVDAVIPNVIVPSSLAICSGVTATITASGATTYSWNGFNLGSPQYFITPLTNTNIVLTANTTSLAVNCLSNHTINITVNQNPTITVVATKTTVCRNQPTTLSASGAANYNWGTLGTTSSVIVSPSVQTVYQVTGTDANGCEGQNSFMVKVVSCNGIVEESLSGKISIFPNPNSGAFFIISAEPVKLDLYNELGQNIMVIDLSNEDKNKFEIKNLASGIYFITGQNGQLNYNKKIIVTR